MKVATACLVSIASASAFVQRPSTFGVASSALSMADKEEYDLKFGSKNLYIPAKFGDGGQGQFGARSPNDWRVPGTSPVGQASYAGAADGGDEPWFSEAISTVSLDLKQAESALKAFTKDAANFKMSEFAKENNLDDKDGAMKKLVDSMGYDKFLEATSKQLAKEWEKLSGKTEKAEK
ncbi:hypothetical protein MPSEU_000580400 [Mayamaea pseudoterrestris]|nr:hypothetical protein MPSEU_000580400 [Mayamaea pseudoterrestris]